MLAKQYIMCVMYAFLKYFFTCRNPAAPLTWICGVASLQFRLIPDFSSVWVAVASIKQDFKWFPCVSFFSLYKDQHNNRYCCFTNSLTILSIHHFIDCVNLLIHYYSLTLLHLYTITFIAVITLLHTNKFLYLIDRLCVKMWIRSEKWTCKKWHYSFFKQNI